MGLEREEVDEVAERRCCNGAIDCVICGAHLPCECHTASYCEANEIRYTGSMEDDGPPHDFLCGVELRELRRSLRMWRLAAIIAWLFMLLALFNGC